MTFDENIRYREEQLHLADGDHGIFLLPKNMVLMEVKIPESLPFWFGHILSELEVFPISFSKYGTYYKENYTFIWGGHFILLDSVLSFSSSGRSVPEFVFCTVFSVIFGVLIALVHMYKNQYSRNFILTLILLPLIVQTVIMLVNGNLGTGVAVAGAFSLVRFRSVPGNSREIAAIFLAMAVGLGHGYGLCDHRPACW